MSLLLTQKSFLLGEWLVKPGLNQLQKRGETTSIEPKLMEVLLCLCRAAPQVVHTNDLIEDCWPNQFISDNPVHKCVAQLRKALNDDARKPQYIKTIPKKGYAIVSTVKDLDFNQPRRTQLWQEGPPYLGSQPYEKHHQDIFFGRQKATSQLKKLINQADQNHAPGILIMGSAKVGKTSILQAAILPFIEQPKKPFKHLQHQPLYLSLDAINLQHLDTIKSALKTNQSVTSRDHPGSTNQRPVLVIDQLERCLLADTDDAELLLQFLLSLCLEKKFLLLLICNHEHYAELMSIDAFHELKSQLINHDIRPLTDDEIDQIITLPVAAAGLGFEYDTERFESLSAVIRRDALELRRALPTISQAMKDLCIHHNESHQLTFTAYESMGRLTGLISNKAETVFSQCNETQMAAFKACLPALVSCPNDEPPKLNTVNIHAITNDQALVVINRLIRSDLVSTENIQGHMFITLVHRSLLTDCPSLRGWLVNNRLQLSIQSEISQQARLWESHQRHPGYLLKNPWLLAHADTDGMDSATHKFYRQSMRQQSQVKHIKVAVMSGVFLLLLTVTGLWISHRETNAALTTSQQQAETLNAFIIRDLKEKLQPIGQLDLLKMLGSKVLNYYQNNPAITNSSRFHHIEALNTLAEVAINQGQHDEAKVHLTQAHLLHKQATMEGKNLFLINQTHYWSGYLAYQQQNWSVAEQHWRIYLHNTRTMTHSEPENSEWILEQSYALNNMGSLMLKQNQAQQAAEFIADSAHLKWQLHQQAPRNTQLLADLSDTISWQAQVMSDNNQLAKANSLLQESLKQAQQLVSLEPNNNQWNHRLALAWYRLSLSYFDLGRLDQAKRHGKSAHEQFIHLVQIDPENLAWNRTLINTATLLAKIHRAQGQLDAAQTYLNQGLNRLEKYPTDSRSLPAFQRLQFNLKSESSQIMTALGQHQSALDLYSTVYQTQTGGQLLQVSEQPGDLLDNVRKLVLFAELRLAANHTIDLTQIRQAQQALSPLTNQFNHKAIALHLKLAGLIDDPPKEEYQSFMNKIQFKNPDYLISKESI